MRFRILAAALVLVAVYLVAATAPAQDVAPTGQVHIDKYPASCDGHPAGDHVDWAKGLVDKGHRHKRFPDRSPMRGSEKRKLVKQKFCVQHDGLRAKIADYREETADDYRRELRKWKAAQEPEWGLAPGVSKSTLDAIAACESGGDPTAVNPAGYYGLFQFDLGTWASVGGSGNPVDASVEEQYYRASVLYARAGSSPWPVCGV
jgi:soluble lytic murein transglycosylase-like protein